MGRLRPVLRTARGVLFCDDKDLTLEDVCQAFTWKGDARQMAASRGGAVRCAQHHEGIHRQLKSYADAHGFATNDARELLTIWTMQLTEVPVCRVCGAKTRFNRQLCTYAKYCSPRCQNGDPDVKARHACTNMRKYGVSNAAMSEQAKRRQAETTMRRYGATCFLATDEGKRKSMDTCMARYGVPHYVLSQESKERRRTTMLARYGVEHPLQSKELRGKATDTCIARYGSPYPNIWRLKELARKQRGEVYDSLEELFPSYEVQCDRSSFLGLYEHENTWKCRECGTVFRHRGVPFCSCRRRWVMEEGLLQLVSGIRSDAVANVRDVLPDGREIDVYVPGLKLGFEFDGLFWHSELYRDRSYHLSKTEAASAAGVRLVHVFEDEWTLRGEVVRSKIAAMLGAPQRLVSGRSCSVSELDRTTADAFLAENHIQGPSMAASAHLGLHDGTELVAVCTFGRIGGHAGDWYLERYATLRGCRVRGGCGKLLAHFIRTHRPELVRTFADRRWSVGGMYDAVGFDLVGTVRPAYWYVRPSDRPMRRIHRFNLRRSALLKELGTADSGEPESELAARCGYLRVWDCGQLVYELRP